MVAVLIRDETYAETDSLRIYTASSKEKAESTLKQTGYVFREDYNAWVLRVYHSTYYATIFTDVKELK